MDWSWATEGITEEIPRITGPECINYMTNRRRWIEAILFSLLFIFITIWAVKRLNPIILPSTNEINRPHSAMRLILLIAMTLTFGIEMGFKFAGKSVIFVMNPCHIQTMVQIYILAAKPNKTTIALFRIQMNYLNGPLLAFLFPEVETRTLPFEQATYWIQHALLYIIPVYIIRTGAYKMEDISDYNWVTIGITTMLLYHFVVLNAFSIFTDINLNHMLCAALSDPFQGQNYRIAAVIHESILCPILNKVTVLIFTDYSNSKPRTMMPLELSLNNRANQTDEQYATPTLTMSNLEPTTTTTRATTDAMLYHQRPQPESEDNEISLAAEMSAALNETPFVIHRRRITQHTTCDLEDNVALDANDEIVVLEQNTDMTNAAITAEYTMPTTKID